MHPYPPSATPDSRGTTLIVGLGKTGLSCARYLHAQGVPVAVTDSRANPPGLDTLRETMPGIPVFTGGFAPAVFASAAQLVVSPGVPVAEPLIQAHLAGDPTAIGRVQEALGTLLQQLGEVAYSTP